METGRAHCILVAKGDAQRQQYTEGAAAPFPPFPLWVLLVFSRISAEIVFGMVCSQQENRRETPVLKKGRKSSVHPSL